MARMMRAREDIELSVADRTADFNYDVHVRPDEKAAPVEYNYRDRSERRV